MQSAFISALVKSAQCSAMLVDSITAKQKSISSKTTHHKIAPHKMRLRSKEMKRLTAQEIIENNKKFIEENNLKSWQEIHAKTIELRLAKGGNK